MEEGKDGDEINDLKITREINCNHSGPGCCFRLLGALINRLLKTDSKKTLQTLP